MTLAANRFECIGNAHIHAGAGEQGNLSVEGSLTVGGRKAILRPRVLLSNTGGTVTVNDGDTFELPPNPILGAVFVLEQASPAPSEGETMTFTAPLLSNVNNYQFQRTGPLAVLASFYGTALGNTAPSATFQFTSGVWRLSSNSGWVQSETQGVLAGAGA